MYVCSPSLPWGEIWEAGITPVPQIILAGKDDKKKSNSNMNSSSHNVSFI